MNIKNPAVGVGLGAFFYLALAVFPRQSVQGRSEPQFGVLKGRPATLHKIEKSWRPIGGPEANSITITAEIDPLTKLQGLFRFTLYDVSRGRGWCMNSGFGEDPDFRFVGNQPDFLPLRNEDGRFVLEGTKQVRLASIVVQAFDSGAFGRLKAEVNIDGIWSEVPADDGKSYITLPLDENENHIADFWEERWGVLGQKAVDDRDPEPGGLEDGDGFSNFEEYRGFVMKGRWSDTWPGLKDVFVVDDVGRGVGHFTKLGVAVHFLDRTEVSSLADRVVNFNGGYASAGIQKAIYICPAHLPETIFGKVEPTVGTPNVVDRVLIDVGKLRRANPDQAAWALAHLLGHAVNITHHGDFPSVSECDKDIGAVGQPGQAHAGEVNCVMRYVFAFPYYDPGDGTCYPYPIEDTFGTDYCISRAGTGLNGGPKRENGAGDPLPMAGAGSRGPCRSSLAVKGSHANGGSNK
ncbi:MAG: hypothetical protein NTU60_08875 [Candidatus Aminicenantes bacterium]|nr:hypothetical protein [Candidatus Aminicenantes bacterium]